MKRRKFALQEITRALLFMLPVFLCFPHSANANNEDCDSSVIQVPSLLSNGLFKITRVTQFKVKCPVSAKTTETRIVDSPYCLLEVTRLTRGDKRFDQSSKYLVSSVDNSCQRKVGEEIELRLVGEVDGDPLARCHELTEADFVWLLDKGTWQQTSKAEFDCIKKKVFSKSEIKCEPVISENGSAYVDCK